MPISDSHAYCCRRHVYYSTLDLDSWELAANLLYLKNCHAPSNGSDNGDDGVSVGANANTAFRSEKHHLQSGEESFYDGCVCSDSVFGQ